MAEQNGAEDEFDFGPPEYLLYRVLSELREQEGGGAGRTKVHKLCILTDRKLDEDFDREIALPKYWYKYGKTLAESELDTSVAFTPRAQYRRGFAYYPADQVSETDFDHLQEDLKDDIYNSAYEVVDEHGDKDYEELERYQYENFSPHEFITSYGDFRWYLASRSIDENQSTFEEFLAPSEKSTIEQMLDSMLIAFDKEEFGKIYEQYLEWDDTIRLLSDQGASARELLDFTELFIEAFAKIVLRLKDRENISEERITKWQAEKEEALEDFETKVERKRRSALLGREVSGELDRVSESYNESISDELEDI